MAPTAQSLFDKTCAKVDKCPSLRGPVSLSLLLLLAQEIPRQGFWGQGRVCTSFEIQQEPAVAKVEVGVITVLMHQLEELRVQDLLEAGCVGVSGSPRGDSWICGAAHPPCVPVGSQQPGAVNGEHPERIYTIQPRAPLKVRGSRSETERQPCTHWDGGSQSDRQQVLVRIQRQQNCPAWLLGIQSHKAATSASPALGLQRHTHHSAWLSQDPGI